MRKIPIKLGAVSSLGSAPISEEELKRAITESRWRPGIALINEVKRAVELLKTFDGNLYRMNEIMLDSGCIEAFLPSEYMEWRDG